MNNEARATRLRNKLFRDISDGKWCLRGTEFCRFMWTGINGQWQFGVWFYCNLKRVRVFIYGDDAFDLPDAENTFTGDDAWQACVEWTVNKLAEMTEAIEAGKQQLYAAAHNEYYRKVFQGE